MSLTGFTLPWVVLAIAIALFALVVAGLPSFSRPWLTRLVRAGLVVLLNIAVLAYAGIRLNNEYQFYTSWTDLQGVSTPAIPTHHGGATKATFASQAMGEAAQSQAHIPKVLPPLPNPGSRMQTYTVTGPVSGTTAQVLVYLPAHYDPSSPKRYPVILALHGFPGHPEAYQHLDNFFGHFDRAVRQHHIADAIIVMPAIAQNSQQDTECVNDPHGEKVESWLATDVPIWVMTHFKAKPNRDAWATFGFSMGGWCSIMLATLHPATFGSAISLQGYFAPSFDPSHVPFAANSEEGRRYDLLRRLRDNPPPIAIWMLASKQDALSYPTSSAALDAVRSPTSLTAVMLPTGGHRGDIWIPKIPSTFMWLGRAAPGFAPPPPKHRRVQEVPHPTRPDPTESSAPHDPANPSDSVNFSCAVSTQRALEKMGPPAASHQ